MPAPIDPTLIAAVWSADWDALSDAAVVPLLPVTTVRDIPLDELVPWLNDSALVNRMRRTVTSGVFAAIVAADPTLVLVVVQDEVLDAIDYLSSPHNDVLATTDAERAAKTQRLLQLMVACNGQDATLGLTADQAAAFIAFGGGLTFAGAVEADVAAGRALAATAREMAARASQVAPLVTEAVAKRAAASAVWDTYIAQLESWAASTDAGDPPTSPDAPAPDESPEGEG